MAEVLLRIVEDPAACARLRTVDMRAALSSKPDLVLVGNTGRTPIEMYQAWGEAGLDLSEVHLRMLDAYLVSPTRGFDAPDHAGSFTRFVVERILGVLEAERQPRDWVIPPEDVATCEEVAAALEEQPEAWSRVPHPITGEPGSEFVIGEGAVDCLGRVRRTCQSYEKVLRSAPIDIVSLGIGPMPYPHMAFNTGPYTRPDAKTHLALLDAATQAANAVEFGGVERVPPLAITAGPGSLVGAGVLWLTAIGQGKAQSLAWALGDPRTSEFFLRSSIGYALRGKRVDLLLDETAASELIADGGLPGLQARYQEAGHHLVARRV